MNVVEHLPPTYEPISDDEQLLFLAGPIQGAPDWQRSAVTIVDGIYKLPARLHVANPRRGESGGFDYRTQVRWERRHLLRGLRRGVGVFWLAAQDPSLSYRAGRSYAQTTRFEFGMTYLHELHNEKPHISLGIEPGYIGSEKYYLDCADELGLPVHDNLEALCLDALQKIYDRPSAQASQ